MTFIKVYVKPEMSGGLFLSPVSPSVTEYLIKSIETTDGDGNVDGNVYLCGKGDIANFLDVISKKKRYRIEEGFNVIVLVDEYYYKQLIQQMCKQGFYQA